MSTDKIFATHVSLVAFLKLLENYFSETALIVSFPVSLLAVIIFTSPNSKSKAFERSSWSPSAAPLK